MTVSIEIANQSLDRELAEFSRNSPSGGGLAFALCPHSRFFDALCVSGRTSDVLVARDGKQIAGFGVRSTKECFVNGDKTPSKIGYLSGLRVAPQYRRGLLLARGYQKCKALHQRDNCKLYLTTIVSSNTEAIHALSAGRKGIPTYQDIGRYTTYIFSPRALSRSPTSDFEIRFARESDLDALMTFLSSEGLKRQFFPSFKPTELLRGEGLLRGLPISKILIALARGVIHGCLGLWDQSEIRSWQVKQYSFSMNLARPLYNLYAAALRKPSLPPPHSGINYLTLALPLTSESSTRAMLELLAYAATKMKQKHDYLFWGLHENDPLTPIARLSPHTTIESRLYAVYWDDGKEHFQALNSYVPYVELGAL